MIAFAIKARLAMLVACAGLSILFALALPVALVAPIKTAQWIRDWAKRGLGMTE